MATCSLEKLRIKRRLLSGDTEAHAGNKSIAASGAGSC